MVYTSMVSSGTAVPRVRAPVQGEYYSRMDGSGEFTRISIQSVSWVEGVLRQLVPYGPPTPATIPYPLPLHPPGIPYPTWSNPSYHRVPSLKGARLLVGISPIVGGIRGGGPVVGYR